MNLGKAGRVAKEGGNGTKKGQRGEMQSEVRGERQDLKERIRESFLVD